MHVAVAADVAVIGGHRVEASAGDRSGTPFGSVSVLAGDAVIDPAERERMDALSPDAEAWWFDAESDIQAEALIEHAIRVSLHSTPLVVVVRNAQPSTPHSGAAIVHLGTVLAEALGGDVLIEAEVPAGMPRVEPREPVEAPLILAQRLATHQGRKLPVGYPADLS